MGCKRTGSHSHLRNAKTKRNELTSVISFSLIASFKRCSNIVFEDNDSRPLYGTFKTDMFIAFDANGLESEDF
jgi:hypothetical protein